MYAAQGFRPGDRVTHCVGCIARRAAAAAATGRGVIIMPGCREGRGIMLC